MVLNVRENCKYIYRYLYTFAVVLEMKAVQSVETLVSGYQALRRQIAGESNVKRSGQPTVQYNPY